jgi:uncharacterized protein (DUF885 family)
MLKLFVAIAISVPVFAQSLTPAQIQEKAREYYAWKRVNLPVWASNEGFHEGDDRLTDYSPAAIQKRRAYVASLLSQPNASAPARLSSRDDEIDLALFRSQLERVRIWDEVLNFEATNPQIYVEEASNAIFSLIKKDYAPAATRARSATARLEKIPALFAQARQNLTNPVRLYSQLAISSARAIDPLYTESIAPLGAALKGADKRKFDAARVSAIRAAHEFADWLEPRLPSMAEWRPIGRENYERILRNVLLLPMSSYEVAELGQVELARYRALEAMLSDPALADPDPRRAKVIPADQQAFLAAYESRQAEMIQFLKDRRIVTIPDFVGQFMIRQLPDAFKPTAPGGFMNPPGLYDRDNSGFYFIPTYNPASRNFYIRAAIEDPRPILGHEGIPGHFLQISIANKNPNEIRRHHMDGVFIEGWALYTEEMLMRTGLYPPDSAAAGQILRLSRYRSARIGVDVNLHTGAWSFEEAVRYFQEAGGLDREAAEGEAAGAASDPTQKISYIVGKWQIMELLGKYRDRKGASFRLGQFHDDLLKNGSLPVTVIERLILE